MVFVPATDTVRVLFSGVGGAGVWQTGFYLGDSQANNILQLEEIATQAETWFKTYILPTMNLSYDFTGVTTTDEGTQDGLRFDLPVTTDNSGGSAGEALPAQCAAVITFLSGFRGRSHRGRMYIPGLDTATTDTSFLHSSAEANFLAAGNAIATAFLGTSSFHVIVSRFSAGAPRTTAVKTDVNAYRVNHVVCTQRRRMFGVGS